MSENENDPKLSNNKVNHYKNHNRPHVAIVGCMAMSLGTAVVTGLKKSTIAHVASSLCFVGAALFHLFMHKGQLSNRVQTGLHPGVNGPRSGVKP